MEMVTLYKRIRKKDHLHYITVESIINEVMESFRGKPNSAPMKQLIKYSLEEHMINRGLDRYFQLRLSTTPSGSLHVDIK
jgi:capsule polysaccharide modification protein KpsS